MSLEDNQIFKVLEEKPSEIENIEKAIKDFNPRIHDWVLNKMSPNGIKLTCCNWHSDSTYKTITKLSPKLNFDTITTSYSFWTRNGSCYDCCEFDPVKIERKNNRDEIERFFFNTEQNVFNRNISVNNSVKEHDELMTTLETMDRAIKSKNKQIKMIETDKTVDDTNKVKEINDCMVELNIRKGKIMVLNDIINKKKEVVENFDIESFKVDRDFYLLEKEMNDLEKQLVGIKHKYDIEKRKAENELTIMKNELTKLEISFEEYKKRKTNSIDIPIYIIKTNINEVRELLQANRKLYNENMDHRSKIFSYLNGWKETLDKVTKYLDEKDVITIFNRKKQEQEDAEKDKQALEKDKKQVKTKKVLINGKWVLQEIATTVEVDEKQLKEIAEKLAIEQNEQIINNTVKQIHTITNTVEEVNDDKFFRNLAINDTRRIREDLNLENDVEMTTERDDKFFRINDTFEKKADKVQRDRVYNKWE